MLHDVIEGLTAAIATIDEETGEWTCLGLVETRDDITIVEDALGSRYEVRSEPFEENIAIAGGHPWIRSASSWEVWARFR